MGASAVSVAVALEAMCLYTEGGITTARRCTLCAQVPVGEERGLGFARARGSTSGRLARDAVAFAIYLKFDPFNTTASCGLEL